MLSRSILLQISPVLHLENCNQTLISASSHLFPISLQLTLEHPRIPAPRH